MAGFFDFLPRGFLGKPAQVSPEELAQAMELQQSVMSPDRYQYPAMPRRGALLPVQVEADRQATWAGAAGFNPQEIRARGGLLGMASTPSTYDQTMMWGGLAPLGITAFHGSPHKFDKFKMEKIGTGEGAQAYGHGLYFAENPGVAKSYQFAGRAAYTNNQAAEKAYRALEVSNGDEVAAKAWLYKRGLEAPENMRQQYFDAMNNFDTFKSTANLYKVDLPDEQVAKMLDWDKPLSQQPESVRKAIEASGLKFPPNATGEQIHRSFAARAVSALDPSMRGISGENQVAASESLRQLGVPGIRYLDQGSRTGGKGTSNFVVFDENLPKMLERNGEKLGGLLEQPKPGGLLAIPRAAKGERLEFEPITGKGWSMEPSRYAKGKVLLRTELDGSGFSTQVQRIAEGVGARWQARSGQRGYILSPAQAEKFQQKLAEDAEWSPIMKAWR